MAGYTEPMPDRRGSAAIQKRDLPMPNFSFVLLYVDNPQASAAFYADLLGRPIVDSRPGFAMLPLSDAVMLGLWLRKDVEPAAAAPAGGSEVAFAVADAAAVKAMCADWNERGLKIVQQPVQMSFGHTFVAADPDGHRLRVFAPAA
jgi:catechol 2,3-dioxygenase-like lactoylglutathione lyase family enzyme